MVLQVPTALAVNFGMLLAFRFITGFVGSPVLATGGASIGDMFRPQKRAYGIGIWGISAICGPVLGPLVGGFAAQAEDWSWTIWELMWYVFNACLMLGLHLLGYMGHDVEAHGAANKMLQPSNRGYVS